MTLFKETIMKYLSNYILLVLVVTILFGCGSPWYKKHKIEVSPGVTYNPGYFANKIDNDLVTKIDSNTLLYHVIKNEEKYGLREKLDSIIVRRAKELNPNYRITSKVLAKEGLDEGRNKALTEKFRTTVVTRLERKYSEEVLNQLVHGKFYINFIINLNKFELSSTQNSYLVPARNSISVTLDRKQVQFPIKITNLSHPQITIPFTSESNQRNLFLTLKKSKFNHPIQGANIGKIKNCNVEVSSETISCEIKVSESRIVFIPTQILDFYKKAYIK